VNCGSQWTDLITRDVSGELTEEERRILEEHLDTCPSCFAERHRAREIERMLGTSPPRQAPPELRDRVMERVEAYDRECASLEKRIDEITKARRRLSWWRDLLPAGSLALSLGILGFLSLVFWQMINGPDTGSYLIQYGETLLASWGLVGGEQITITLIRFAAFLFVGVSAAKLLDLDRMLRLRRVAPILRFW
jgi:hypothetical protein